MEGLSGWIPEGVLLLEPSTAFWLLNLFREGWGREAIELACAAAEGLERGPLKRLQVAVTGITVRDPDVHRGGESVQTASKLLGGRGS